MQLRIPFSKAPHYKRIARLIKPKTFVLDLGCGSGDLGAFLSKKLSCLCVGLDVQSQAYRGERGLFIQADGEQLPFREGVFDVVMSTHLMEHVRNCVRSLHEQIRVLKPDGQFILCQADLLSPLQILDIVFLCPLRSRGQYGGIRWLRQLGKGVVHDNYYCGLAMRDEEIHTRFYWRQVLEAVGLKEIQLPFKIITYLGTIYMTANKSSREK